MAWDIEKCKQDIKNCMMQNFHIKAWRPTELAARLPWKAQQVACALKIMQDSGEIRAINYDNCHKIYRL